jgi:5'-3' exonuclease
MCRHVPRGAPLVSCKLQCLGLLVCLFHSGVCLPQPRLAPSVQADLLREKINAQANTNDSAGTLVSLDQYHALTRRLHLVFPPPLYFIEAKAAHEVGDATRALSALTKFLHRAYRDDQYKEALALYPQYQQLAEGGDGAAKPRLSPDVQGDLWREKIYAQAKANDSDATLVSLDQYHKLAQRLKLVFPPPLYLVEAKAAHETGDATRALSALTEFLHRTNRHSNQYKDALALYPQYQQSAAKGDGN